MSPQIVVSIDQEINSTHTAIANSNPDSPNSTIFTSKPSAARRTGSFMEPFLASSSVQQHTPITLFKQDKKWRWWNFLSIFITLLIIGEIAVLSTSYNTLNQESTSIRFVKRQYPFKTYTHLDTSMSTQIEKGTRVYHVTKEFGPAAISELGKTVTALAAAQQASNLTEVAIVMPFYSFMKRTVRGREIDMVMDIRGKKPGQIMTVEFRVWKTLYAFNPPVQAPSVYEWKMINNVNTSVLLTPQRPPAPTDAVPVYMISHANRKPFNQAFECRTPNDINVENELPNEWRDQYFAKAAAAFLAHKATASDEESIFAPIRIVPRVDIVHIHGASNAYVAKLLQDKKDADDLGPRPPAIVYSVYNHQDEIQYTNSFRNVRKFLDHINDREQVRKYVYGGKMYMSKLAIERADAVTFTSRSTAADIVEGRHDFHMKELVMDDLLKKVEGSRLYGINSAVDYHNTEHPFITDKLMSRNMGFPQYGLQMIKDQELIHSTKPLYPLALQVPDTPTYWTLSEDPNDFIFMYKDRAKRYLIRRSLFTEEDLKRPVVLFRNHLENNTGIEAVEEAAKFFAINNMRLVIMGNKHTYPIERLEELVQLYPNHVSLIYTPKQQRQLGIFCRAAADFVFSPNPNDHEGLDTAEGMVFGSAVITAGGGNLREALIDRPLNQAGSRRVSIALLDPEVLTEKGAVVTSYEYYNSYKYTHQDLVSLRSAIQDAAKDYEKFYKNKAYHEEFILRMIRSALNLGWDRGHFKGPVHEYNQVYELALEDRLIPEMRRHEVEQEHELVSRLQDEPTSFDWE
ncbi:starch synthase catalytic domain-containing protein [Gilbertella persicaria]|uniref:starch synthase catalytic domain-containing protein n=1 Tax=Gilbertella persicaria TaxID=101096 RepID=UPI00222081BD|nr:starch synthase catalytic domain-containing protein [Gilbertella persicaria]KAI8076711.1 starch synthase catalytic domain-containing protein [Gilbertella persicaria]